MNELKIISGYEENPELRLSFNRLANQVFGIDFEKWYRAGFWSDSYICHSFLHQNEIVSNVSASRVTLSIRNQNHPAILIGTVMTHPDYRKRGLAEKLMKAVIEKYEDEADLIYLFANKNSTGFYPRFGFKPVQESRFSVKMGNQTGNKNWVKLDISKPNDLKLLTELSVKRHLSGTFGVLNAEHILYWYCINFFKDDIYYLPEEEIITIFKKDHNTLHVYDVIGRKSLKLSGFIGGLAGKDIHEAVLYFTPGDKDISYQIKKFDADEILFVRSKSDLLPETFKYPITAQA